MFMRRYVRVLGTVYVIRSSENDLYRYRYTKIYYIVQTNDHHRRRPPLVVNDYSRGIIINNDMYVNNVYLIYVGTYLYTAVQETRDERLRIMYSHAC